MGILLMSSLAQEQVPIPQLLFMRMRAPQAHPHYNQVPNYGRCSGPSCILRERLVCSLSNFSLHRCEQK